MTDETHDQQPSESTSQSDAGDLSADEQVGTGTAPGQPPAVGTGERGHRTTSPPTGRVDPQRAAWGASEDVPGGGSIGQPPQNVGGAQGDRPADSVGDFPSDDTTERAGFPPSEDT